jgi:hypothetical protein
LNAGDVVKIYDGTTYLGDATINPATHTWTYQVGTAAAAGSHAYTAKIENAGTTVSTSNSYAVNMVTPVVLDLNQDGVLDYSQIKMDLNADGILDTTAWVAAQDGLLMHDAYGDGSVRSTGQFAFARSAGETDLQGLAAQFDSNHDGVLDAKDTQFGEFAVWQDTDQDGLADAGEVKHLVDMGITSINLTSDGVVRTPASGVIEAGHTTAQLADGTQMLVADAAFSYSPLDYSVVGNSLNLSGANINLDFSSVVASNNPVTAVDLTGIGSNSIKLMLADVLNTPTTSTGVHQLTLTGDVNDSVKVTASEWTDTGTTVTQAGHAYEVYNAITTSAVQLLIDQHLTVTVL